MRRPYRKHLGRFVIGTGQGDMVGFILLPRKSQVRIAHHFSRDRAVWFCTWDQTIRYGPKWDAEAQGCLTLDDAAELARLLRAATKEGLARAQKKNEKRSELS